MHVSVAETAAELYGLPPAQFRAARDERAAAARAAGQREAAAAISKLARPTVSAWLVNRLVRDAPEAMAKLFELGKQMREAQRVLAGDRLKGLASQRRQLIAELLARANRLAAEHAVTVTAQARREVQTTLEAALAVPDSAQAVRAGQLIKPLAYSGLGTIDQRAVRAAASAATQPPGDSRQRALQRGEDLARQAQVALQSAERRLASVADRHAAQRDRVSGLERQLAAARTEEARTARELAAAQKERDAAARAAESALRRLDSAKEQTRPRLRLVPPLPES